MENKTFMVSQLDNVSCPQGNMERKKQQRWNGNKNLHGLTAGQCEFYPQGNEKAEHKCNMPSARKGSEWN